MSGVLIQMMGSFNIINLDGEQVAHKLGSKKGSQLMQYLILSAPNPVPCETLIDALSLNRTSGNPQNALKTLVSRTRKLLNDARAGLGDVIASKHGSYAWRAIPGASADVCELEEIFDTISRKQARLPKEAQIYERAIALYAGDLYYAGANPAWIENRRVDLRKKYLSLSCDYLAYLKQQGDKERMLEVCRAAMSVDGYDKRLHVFLMDALGEAGVSGEDAADNYGAGIKNLNRAADQSIEALCDELTSHERSSRAFICSYREFMDICDMQFRFADRNGASMFIALIGVTPRSGGEFDSRRVNEVSRCLNDTLSQILRKGDAITQLAPLTYAVSLPMVDYATSRTVLERVKENFYAKNTPYKDAIFSYRTQPFTRQGGVI